ncbi:T9SS type A sorting domain-containing protein [Hymenobacter sp. GOD-10R]|uniref:T9SS type A sorting domain-containing protein n=1 Tax=Hymenobacter sp. GOD-10R TaxID=3093922 RepID=UPI002D77F3C6|nr:T9SS type A sorting domain-containing protein [Hymenobacter sp. GOD-10R]WRQ27904.1 T9SS type A sorting domain-containing protein [Hymenobacter sp. GOD-10R]
MHNLVIDGNAPNNKAVLKLTDGRLEVFGNFSNAQGGFEQGGGVFQLAANGDQSFDGDNFFNFEVSGSGNKKLIGQMTVQGELRFQGGILMTDPTLPTTNNVTLLGNATMQNEAENTYLSGTVTARQVVNQGDVANFGNLGLRYEKTSANAGETLVTRITSISYPSASKAGQSVRRSFNVIPANDVTAQITFNYLDVERGSLNENLLVLYRSTNGGATFDQLGKDGQSTANNFVSKGQIPGSGLFTVSVERIPLPVALTSFTAARQGADAALTWVTAQEENNAGFDVQVSTDGSSFRTLTTITPKSPNSSIGATYKYIDQELGKTGIRYYRLRQSDVDGKESFYGPKAVEFGDAAVAFSAAPNPFNSEVMLTAQTSVAGAATLRLTDINGRTVREQALSLNKGVSTLPMSDLDALKGGMYFVQLTLPNGQVQRLKVLKQ